MTIALPPFPNSYWVEPGKFLAGEYPGAHDSSQTKQRLQKVILCGITYFLDLTDISDPQTAYYPDLKEIASELNLNINYRRIPIRDFSTPSITTMRTILDVLDLALDEGRSVYVHCLGGIGRTGTVVGCHLVRHGIPGDQALERLATLRKDTADWWYPSPEAPSQVAMIKSWKIGD